VPSESQEAVMARSYGARRHGPDVTPASAADHTRIRVRPGPGRSLPNPPATRTTGRCR